MRGVPTLGYNLLNLQHCSNETTVVLHVWRGLCHTLLRSNQGLDIQPLDCTPYRCTHHWRQRHQWTYEWARWGVPTLGYPKMNGVLNFLNITEVLKFLESSVAQERIRTMIPPRRPPTPTSIFRDSQVTSKLIRTPLGNKGFGAHLGGIQTPSWPLQEANLPW